VTGSDIIARLEAATGADREIDVLVWAVAEGHKLEWQGSTLVAGEEGVIGWKEPGIRCMNFYTNRRETGPGSIPAYTASLDAALALVGEKLPGCRVMVEQAFDGSGWAMVMPGELSTRHVTEAPTPALAVLLALFRALPDGAGHSTASNADASRAPGMNKNPPTTEETK
jgi:hypothetical protein